MVLSNSAQGISILPGGSGSGVTSLNSQTGAVTLANANGVSWTQAAGTITPALGAITPSSVVASGNVSGSNLSGTNTGDQTSVSGNAGTATKWANARNLAGNSVDGSANVAFSNAFIVQGTADSGLSGAQFLGALGTGLLKNTTTTGVLSTAVAGTDYAAATAGTIGGVNVSASLSAVNTQVTVTADEVCVSVSLGGNKYILGSYSQLFNSANTGAGGMDTGSLPTSGFVAIYAIYGTNGTSILGVNASTSSGMIYSGVNMPSGYTYSCLLGIWPTNSTPKMIVGILSGRQMGIVGVKVVSGGTVTSATSVSLSSCVPPGAKNVSGYITNASSTNGNSLTVQLDTTGCYSYNSGAYQYCGIMFSLMPLTVSQTCYYMTGGYSTNLFIIGYGW